MCREQYLFQAVNESNRKVILDLRLEESQEHFIETPEECLDEAKEMSCWVPMGIYYEKILIGFTMYGRFEDDRVWLDRFLIDRNYQGKGHGRKSIVCLIEKLFSEYCCEELYLSLYDDNRRAMDLYQKLGFTFNGELDTKGEKVMKLSAYEFSHK